MHDPSSPLYVERFARHLMLREIGGPGQQKLARARVALVGMGGLGAPAALYLAAAGVGHLRLIDPDQVSLSNLQRQVLYDTHDVGRAKVVAAAAHLQALDPECELVQLDRALTPDNARELLTDCDIVLDGTDSFATRFAVNRAALAGAIPLVSGAVGRWDGQLSVFAPHLSVASGPRLPCYQCLVPDLPDDEETCAAVGIVGALTGIVGSMMALEAIKLISGAGTPLLGRVMFFNALDMSQRIVTLVADPACPACGKSQGGA